MFTTGPASASLICLHTQWYIELNNSGRLLVQIDKLERCITSNFDTGEVKQHGKWHPLLCNKCMRCLSGIIRFPLILLFQHQMDRMEPLLGENGVTFNLPYLIYAMSGSRGGPVSSIIKFNFLNHTTGLVGLWLLTRPPSWHPVVKMIWLSYCHSSDIHVSKDIYYKA